jgi:sialic acid synthase SpsE
VIAEPGSTHEGQFFNSELHIKYAAEAGASAIKFQWLSSPYALAEKRNALKYVPAYSKISFPLEWHKSLMTKAHVYNLQYGCSVYLKQDVKKLTPYVDFFKVSSFEAHDLELLAEVGKSEKPLYISLGMNSEAEVTELVKEIDSTLFVPGRQNRWIYLYCVTGYPCPTSQLNLDVLRRAPYVYEGFSDHSCDVTVGARAYAAGARIFEVHTRLPETPVSNEDYAVSLTYGKLKSYVNNILEQKIYSGKADREVQPIEKTFLKYRSH